MKDFFISYNKHDKQWAEWIAWTLEEAGYTVVIQAWDFRPGGNFVLAMQRASAECEKTIAVLSEHYLKSEYAQSEWSAAFAVDPQGLQRKLIPVRVGVCKPDGVLKTIVYVDLVGVTEPSDAKQRVLDALKARARPDQEPTFPGAVPTSERTEPDPVAFPPTEEAKAEPEAEPQPETEPQSEVQPQLKTEPLLEVQPEAEPLPEPSLSSTVPSSELAEPVEFSGVETIGAIPAAAAIIATPIGEVPEPESPIAEPLKVETPEAGAPIVPELETGTEPDPTPDKRLLLGLTRRGLISGFVAFVGEEELGRFFLTAPAKSVLPPEPVKPTPTATPTATPAVKPAPKVKPNPLPTTSDLQLQPFDFTVVTVNEKGSPIKTEKVAASSFNEELSKGNYLEMVSISSGTFFMGAPETEAGTATDERSRHLVRVNPFFMGKVLVTQAQWLVVSKLPKVIFDLDPNCAFFKGLKRPVERVSWNDAFEFCNRLSRHTGREYRLPSEAEWEYACRAGTNTPFHFGETITTDLANYDGNYTYGGSQKGLYRARTTDVAAFSPNAFGLYDMHGNVWEWCLDRWHDNYQGAPTDGSAWIEGADSTSRLVRGGSWFHDPAHCRSAYRSSVNPFALNYDIGFRVVCSA